MTGNKGTFTKGDPRINRKGRPKGSKTSPDEMREWITYILEKNWHRLEAAIDAMTDEKAAYFMVQYLLKYRLPAPQDDVLRLSEEQFTELIKRLKHETTEATQN